MFGKIAKRIYELPAPSDRFQSMDGLRAYAAFLVFLVHYFDSYANNRLGVDPNMLRLGQIDEPLTAVVYYLFASHYGVDIFFFLSGFLIFRIVTNTNFSYGAFIVQRILRIYPAVFVSILIWAYIRIGYQQWFDFDVSQFVGNLLFLNAVPPLGVQPYNAVTWTLFYEFLFYVTLPVMLLLRLDNAKPGAVHVIIGAMLVYWLSEQLGHNTIRFLMFFGGALMACFSTATMQRLEKYVPEIMVICLYLGSTFFFAMQLSYQYFIPLFLVTTFLLVLKVIHGNGVLNRLFSLTPLRYMGNISYSFYLMHGLGLQIVVYSNVFAQLTGVVYFALTFILSLLLSILLSTVLFLLTEKPYFTRKHRQKRALKPLRVVAHNT